MNASYRLAARPGLVAGGLLLALALAPGRSAAQSTPRSPQPSSRTLILDEPGAYALRRNIQVPTGDGIVITASGVTLDLAGHNVGTESPGTGRGILVEGAKGVAVRNGRVGGFNANVLLMNAENVRIEEVQVVGRGLPPSGGPAEMGIVLVNTRGSAIEGNQVSSVNLGLFVRGTGSTGNRIAKNTITGGGTAASNLLGICYNPAPGGAPADPGPRGDLVYNNHISRFGFAIAISSGSIASIFRENNLASFMGGFREPGALVMNGGTNVADGNVEVTIPSTDLP